MKIMQGCRGATGVAHGPVQFWGRDARSMDDQPGHDPQRERRRLKAALADAVNELLRLAQTAREKTGEEGAMVFEAHAMLLEDEDFAEAAERWISQGYGAEYAVEKAGEEAAGLLAGLSSPYLQARAVDVRDATEGVVRRLSGEVETAPCLEGPVVLAADELPPSELIRLDRDKLLALVTRGGTENSHTSILARTMGIPAVCGLGEALDGCRPGQEVWVDGESGQLILNPDRETLERLTAQGPKRQRIQQSVPVGGDAVSPSGRRIRLSGNITFPDEVGEVLANGGQGIGLYRSEFLFLAARSCPTEEEQFQAYRQAVAGMGGRRVTIRTLDLGADKQATWLPMAQEANPAMGLKGIRVSLTWPELFRTQLRALYRASAYGTVAILFPMISSIWEAEACRQACQSVMEELTEENIPFNPKTELGLMIETPAAVFMASELAGLADFFSIGTNDLTQYTLACDRQNGQLSRFFNPHHPAVLRAVKQVTDAAHQAGIWVGICGELGADPAMLPTFLAMGMDELSVLPAALPALRAAVETTPEEQCTLEWL